MIVVFAVFAAIAAVIYLFYETVHAEVVETRIVSERIRSELKIVQISDLHGRTRFWTGTIGDIVDSLKPDIVCVTGDLFNRLDQLPEVMRELSRLECEYLFFVPGNHEREERKYGIRRKFSEEEFVRVLREIGVRKMRVLANEGELIEVKRSDVYVYGFDNSLYGRERYAAAQDDTEGAFRLMLAHSPGIMSWLDKRSIGYDLLLAGHTHGGQIRLFGKPLGPYGRYHTGLKEVAPGRFAYVNRGLGTVHLPFRIGCRPEISLIRVTPLR
ncbi:metallophosphoesterase [Paenibacillus hodogayensis]|uniref:Metallophosphoesterase n=1 Tax=Paenibacillus hodogayensis TaxID=279208 RepID=A0ABV5VRJ9_9BACL